MKKLGSLLSNGFYLISEFLYQVAYVGFAIGILLTLYNIVSTYKAIIYTAFMVIHFASIYYYANKIDYYEFGKEREVTKGFIIFSIALLIITSLLTNVIYTIILGIYLTVTAIIYVYCTENLICYTASGKRPLLERIFAKKPRLFLTILILLPITSIIIPIAYLPWNIFIKTIVVIAYIIAMPFIALATDDGFDISGIFLY